MGLYYLQSRYYDANIGRFINADGVVSGIGKSIKGYNPYSYCFNNPMLLSDEEGSWPKFKDSVKWFADKHIKPVVKGIQKAFSRMKGTYSTGGTISGFVGIGVGVQGGMSIDSKGNVALQGTFIRGFSSNCGGSITAYNTRTNAPSIDNLNGPGYQIGGSYGFFVEGFPVCVGADFNIIPNEDANEMYLGVSRCGGIGIPGLEMHVEYGTTETWGKTQFNVFNAARDIYIGIMEW